MSSKVAEGWFPASTGAAMSIGERHVIFHVCPKMKVRSPHSRAVQSLQVFGSG